ncbi:hypothetical protein BVX93_00640 [bacterium B13(2017)]|nr:hypothetical protein BVX93_00640 [bacterium B13(2017)]
MPYIRVANEKRKNSRYPFKNKIRSLSQVTKEWIEAFANDVSLGGMQFETPKCYSKDTYLHIQI